MFKLCVPIWKLIRKHHRERKKHEIMVVDINEEPYKPWLKYNMKRYELIHKSQVSKVVKIYTTQNEPVCMKIYNPLQCASYTREVNILGKLQYNPYVVTPREYWVTDKYEYIVMDYMEGPTLLQFLNGNLIKMSLNDKKMLILRMLQILHSIHVNGIVHRDVKPENFMFAKPLTTFVNSSTKKEFLQSLVIIDFNMSQTLQEDMHIYPYNKIRVYTAPECYTKTNDITGKCDIYSAAIIFFIIMNNGLHPSTVLNKDISNVNNLCTQLYNEDMWNDFFEKAYERHPQKRFSAANLCNHVWMIERSLSIRIGRHGQISSQLSSTQIQNTLEQGNPLYI